MTIVLNGDTGITSPGGDTQAADTTINGVRVGRGAGSVATNTAVGASALAANTSGAYNSVFGYGSLNANTTGQYNTAVGGNTLLANTTGTVNSAFGLAALSANTSGSYNVGIGPDALRFNTTANYNTAVGYQAGYSNTTSIESVFVGYRAGYLNTGQYNTYVGGEAGRDSTTGTFNTFVGVAAGYLMTTGAKNTILGGYNGNQGGLDIRTDSSNIVLSDGDGIPWYRIQGSNGQHNLRYKNDNVFRTAFTQSYFGYSTTYGCLVIGQASGNQTVSIGYDPSINASGGFSGLGGETIFRRGMSFITPNSSNTAFFVQFSMTDGVTSGDFNDTSDIALKENIQSIPFGWDTVKQLRPVTFDWKQEGKGSRSGFIAQEVEALLPNDVLGEEYVAPDREKNIEGTAGKSINTTGIVAHLTKALQEAMTRIEQLEARLDAADL